MEPLTQERRNTDHWSIKKEISLGDLVAIATAIVAIMIAYIRLNDRVTTVEVTSQVQQQTITTTMQELRTEIRRLADSFDRYKENGGKH